MSELTQGRLRELLKYDSDSGYFIWRTHRRRNFIGKIARENHAAGYHCVRVDGCVYLAHRLAWLYLYGSWPKNEIDHINGVRSDNRIWNLREATRSENARNRTINKNNSSGKKGVSHHKATNKWRARIRVSGRLIMLGYFETIAEASTVYESAAKKYFGEFVRGQ